MKFRIVLIVLLCLNAVAAACLLIPRMFSGSEEKEARPVRVMCGSCGKTYNSTEHDYPLACPDCGKREVYPAYKCEECGALFNRKQASPDGDSAHLQCPECGSEAVHPVDAEHDG